MKRLLIVVALLSSVMGGWAQTDMTSYINDPDFEQEGRSVWKTNSFGRQTNNDFELKHGTAYREVWSGSTVGDAYLYQDISKLPVGTYTLTMTCQAIKQSEKSKICKGAWIYANDQTVDINKPGDYSVTCVVKDGNLRIGAETKSCDANYVCLDNCRLSYQVIFDDIADYLKSLIDEVNKIDKKNNSDERNEMIEARDEMQKLVDAKSSEGLDSALKRLQSAITAYRFSLASASNPVDLTEMIADPSFENGGNGWTFSSMGTQSNSDFPGKVGNIYAETWTDWGNHVSDSYLKQTIKDMPNGRYRLTASAWNVQQSNTNAKQTGTYLFINTTTTVVSTLNTYSVEGVNVSGEITIGLKNVSSTGNYICVDNFKLYFLGADKEAEAETFQALIKQAEDMTAWDMNTADKDALQKALDNAKGITGTEGRSEAVDALTVAMMNAENSHAYYVELDKIIKKGQDALAEGKANGTDKLNMAIDSAQGMKNSGKVDTDMLATASNMMDDAIFAYHVLNGSGTAPKATTGEVIVGSRAMVGRMSYKGSNILETGFCWAENPNPTVLDYHSSNNQSNDETNGSPVYVMYDVEPSTELWVRAYAISKTYAVGYGDPVRVITLPKGETEYTYLWNGDDDHNEWLDNAMREATAYYNTWTAIKGFHPTANYSPGTETADCSYGGWINVGPWRCNTGTMVHEMMHGTGVGQHGRWWSAELHNLDKSVVWLGERANRVCHFFENYDSSRGNYNCNGDGMHVCYEGNGNDMQQIRSAILMQALYEDGLPAVSDGACPFYSYESIDTLTYYITNMKHGTNSKYLCESNGKLMYKAVDNTDELFANDSFAWFILYDKMTGLYSIRNKQTGKYFNHGGSSVTLTAKEPASANKIQLMPTRIFADINTGSEKLQMKPYWFARGNRVENPNVMAITSITASAPTTPSLNFGNDATEQFFIICTPDELLKIEQGNQKQNSERLERMIKGSMAVAASAHAETIEGQDEAFLEVVEKINLDKDEYTPTEVNAAINDLYTNLQNFLPQIIVTDSIDVSFVMDDPELNTGNNWEGLIELKDGMVNSTNTEVFTATQKSVNKMPKGQYGILIRGYQRPGVLATVVKEFVNDNKNNVKAYVTLNASNKKIKHIAEGGDATKLGKGGTEIKYAGIYVPSSLAASKAYFEEGRYDNLVKAKQTSLKQLTIGIKNTATIENDLLMTEGFTIYYYGNSDVQTDIENVDSASAGEIEGYYNMVGVRLQKPGQGITIVKCKDGHSEKIYR